MKEEKKNNKNSKSKETLLKHITKSEGRNL
jgi:hypothetical protein